jgi:hypothetical protein
MQLLEVVVLLVTARRFVMGIMLQLEAQATSQALPLKKEIVHTAMFRDIHLVIV